MANLEINLSVIYMVGGRRSPAISETLMAQPDYEPKT
jgi:hypothetical protein